MNWQGVLDGIDAAESWVVGLSFWVQAPLLLVVVGGLSWLVAGFIDRFVERQLRRNRYRRLRGPHRVRVTPGPRS